MNVKTDTPSSAVNPPLTQREVAALFGVSMKTIFNWRAAGILPSVTIGGTVRIRQEDVLALMNNPVTQ